MRAMHQNSQLSWHSLDREARKKAILGVYLESAEPLTDREVMKWLGFTDMNAIRPRCTELIQSGELVECGDILDETTHRKVRLVAPRGRSCIRRMT